MSRIIRAVARSVVDRLTTPPLALKAHALLVVAAAVVVGAGHSMVWFAPTVVVLVLWPVLRGSRYGWWIQLAGITFSIAGLLGVLQHVHSSEGLTVFVPTYTVALLAAMLVTAWLLLLTPSVRRFCSDPEDDRRTLAGTVLAVLFVGTFPAMALSLEPRLPSDSFVDQARTSGLVFAGTDARGPVAFYVGRKGGDLCVLVLEPRGGNRSCATPDHRRLSPMGHVLFQAVPKRVARVEITDPSGTRRELHMLSAPGAPANVAYMLDPPRRVTEARAYDTAGNLVYRCRELEPC